MADKLSYHYGHNSTAFSFCPAKFLFFCKLLYLVLLLLPITPYGIEHGGNRNNQDEKNSSCRKTQSQLASDMGMDVRTLQNYKMLADMIPELSDTKKTPPESSPLVPCVSVL